MRLRNFLYGVKMGIPVMIGFIPVAIAFAIMAMDAGLNTVEAISMSIFVFAGASQMMSVGMIAEGAGMLSIVIATLIMNLRHFIMSTCVFQRMERTSATDKLICSFGVTDESFAIFTTAEKERCNKWFFLGVFISTYLSWVVGTAIGALASAILPAVVSDSLGIALYAMFIALLVPGVKKNIKILGVVIITALLNLGLGYVLPSSWALIVATLVGAGVGVFIVPDTDEEVAQ